MPRKPKNSRLGGVSAAHAIDPNAAGIDIGATEIYIAVPVDRGRIRCAVSPLSPKTFSLPLTGSRVVGLQPWPWNQPASTGYPCFRFWKSAD